MDTSHHCPASRLRGLFRRAGLVRLVGAHNALGARLAERAGFDGVWSSGLEVSASHGVPDADILTMTELLAAAESMAASVRIPVVADCDTGYGNCHNVIRLVTRYEAAGVAAVCLEDKIYPKVNSFLPNRQELIPTHEFVGKISAAKDTQRSLDFVVIARIEALVAGLGVDEALHRAHAYADAGADAVLIHAKGRSPEPVLRFAAAWDRDVPVVVVPTTYHTVTPTELEDAGVKMVIYANHGLRASIQAMTSTFAEILTTGGSTSVEDRIASLNTVFDLQGVPEMQRREARYLGDGGIPGDQRTDDQPPMSAVSA